MIKNNQHIFLSLLWIAILIGYPLHQLFAQQKKTVQAIRVENPPKIDANLSDLVWEQVPEATDFVQQIPNNGEPPSFETRVKFIYDDKALYIGAMMFDPNPDSILTELGQRDEISMVDNFGVYIDCFNDYLNAYGFIVTAAGIQVDLRSSIDDSGGDGWDHGDKSWDAVWSSEVKIIDNGWVAELKIPYSALRFPMIDQQLWSVQIIRDIKRYRETVTWNLIDPEEEGVNNQSGELHGIKNINPPFRLSLVPYVSGYVEKNPESTTWGYYGNYGLDLKYGINESYTLDMTLIPDFGQVQSDDEIYNLSPFEVYYDEKRPFFMEGTELFEKGNIFYSRRIGGEPQDYEDVENHLFENEKIASNPHETPLINATKITGKGQRNLGVGLFNAMTANTYAEVKDTLTGYSRQILSNPFTNYNMLVFDKALKNNSFISLYNTNVLTPQKNWMANVTGTETRLVNKNNRYGIWTQGIISQKYKAGDLPEFGYRFSMSAGKLSGNFTYELDHTQIDEYYDPNDMGFLGHNNIFSDRITFAYNIYKPFWKMLNWSNSLWINYKQLYNPMSFTEFNINIATRGTSKKHLTTWLSAVVSPVKEFDYFEPRVDGRYIINHPFFSANAGVSPDYRKRFVIDARIGFLRSSYYDQGNYWFNLSPRFRVSDHLMIIARLQYKYNKNDIGYVTQLEAFENSEIIFGRRNVETFENILDIDYRFNNKASLGFRLRHYFIPVRYFEFFDLQLDGTINSNNYTGDHDFNYNVFNIDLVYVWNFAPGSELSAVWKNYISSYDDISSLNSVINNRYFDNLDYTFKTPATNSFSIKVLYYLDYQYLKKSVPKKN